MELSGNAATDALRIFHELVEHCDAADALARERLGLNFTDFRGLKILSEHPGSGPGDLARRLGISSAAATAVQDRLAAHGYITLTVHPRDRRRNAIHVNDAVIDQAFYLTRQLMGEARTVIEQLPPPVSDELVQGLLQVSERMRAALNSLPTPTYQQQRDEP
ncbi:MarR family transcriptional regulator [Glutamicibacter sp. V16R2B1]|uniref:MarR family transcriptional regulator n=1 Tax=Glutamicibacter sp. V16R2B1 TaxID=2036207 RepID=UPI0010FD4B43|nr:MarR family transcriptional regulator [Glutamicibacter sp. V16R2B1]TLK48692.1 MarR family transcriptional regulator [Glutamicibacter sp. V16R2B1]